MDTGLGVEQNDPNLRHGVNTVKIATPVNIFKFAIFISIVLIGSYGLLIDTNALLISCLLIQGLFITLLTVMAIIGIKDKTKVKKNLSYTYLIVSLFSLTIGIISVVEILKYR